MNPVTIYVIRRSSDVWAGFHDDLTKPGAWAAGRNRYEAVGDLIIHNPERVTGGIVAIVEVPK